MGGLFAWSGGAVVVHAIHPLTARDGHVGGREVLS